MPTRGVTRSASKRTAANLAASLRSHRARSTRLRRRDRVRFLRFVVASYKLVFERAASNRTHLAVGLGNLDSAESVDAYRRIIDVALDLGAAGVDAPAPKQRVLEADDIGVTHDALAARLHAQRFGL
jgi:hypothetical protein